MDSNSTADVGKMDMLFLVYLHLLEHLCEVLQVQNMLLMTALLEFCSRDDMKSTPLTGASSAKSSVLPFGG